MSDCNCEQIVNIVRFQRFFPEFFSDITRAVY